MNGGVRALILAVALLAALVVPANADLVTFTGDAEVDFNTVTHRVLAGKVYNFPDIVPGSYGQAGCLDQPLGPFSFNPSAGPPAIQPSGFNIESVYTAYDCTTDMLYIGLHLCGDRVAWDADFNDNIVTSPLATMDPSFADDGLEEYALSFDVSDVGPFVKSFGVSMASMNGGTTVQVSLNGPDPVGCITACAYLVGGPMVCAPGTAGPRAQTGNEKDIEVRIGCIRTRYALSGDCPMLRLHTRSSVSGDMADDDLTDQLIPLPLFEPSIADAKQLANDQPATLTAKTVTYAAPNVLYIEEDSRSMGIRVEKPGHTLAVGKKAYVAGPVKTNDDGERYIEADIAEETGSGSVGPLGMRNVAVGGTDWSYVSPTGQGQRGIHGASGLNNIGLLVTTWGEVSAAGRNWFYIDDGGRVQDGTGFVGVYVDAAGLTAPVRGACVSVTGISSCEFYDGQLVNVLRPRSQSDILVASSPTGILVAASEGDNPRRRGTNHR